MTSSKVESTNVAEKNSRLDLNKSFDRERHNNLKIVSPNNVPLELVQENFFEYTDSQSVIGDQILFPDRITNESLKKGHCCKALQLISQRVLIILDVLLLSLNRTISEQIRTWMYTFFRSGIKASLERVLLLQFSTMVSVHMQSVLLNLQGDGSD